ncbi:MAG: dephospho-CoA kinase [Candidatus Kapaibacterium sp.]|nr:MAG: dephospho-CoA kinase [Candidatus Kapabacteria bacterium]
MAMNFQHFQNIKTAPTQAFIGITGGIGSGKSTIAEIIRANAYTVLSADDIGRELTNSDAAVKASINAEFGEMYHADGTLNRAKMSELVFGASPAHAEALVRLNAIVHPAVWKAVAERVQSCFAKGETLVFNETALLFETGADVVYDAVIVVDAQEEIRIQRLAEGRNIPPEEARKRILAQMPAEEKKARANFVINNDGSRNDAEQATMSCLDDIRQKFTAKN